MESQEASIEFPYLAKGRLNLAPPRALTPDAPAIFRDSLNFIPRDGLMQRRPGLTSMPTTAKALPPSVYDLTPTTNGERPVWVYSGSTSIPQTYATVNGGINGTTPYRAFVLSAAQTVSVVVTNRQMFIYNEALGVWLNVTPTYVTGTVAVTNGSPNIVGTGTVWSTRGISPFQHIKIGARWYQISVVVDDTHITLSENFMAATAGGLAYTIMRTWGRGNSDGADRSSSIFCVAYNQSIIIAGSLLGRADGVVTPTVIKVDNFMSATPTTSYLTSSFALVAGLDIITIGSISGLAVLQDSRVILSGDQSTIFYSSNLVQTVWSATPAGFTIVEHKSGAIHAMEWLGSNLAIHFETGIVFGIPTGQSDPPLNFVDSGATVGCVVPKSLKEWEKQQIFIGFDCNVYVFDGSSTHPIGDDVRRVFDGTPIETLKNGVFSAVNARYGEYTVYLYSGSATFAWTLTRDGSWWPLQYPAPIGAVSDQDAISGTRAYGIAGIYSMDQSTEKNMLWELSTGFSTDSVTYFALDSGGHFLEFDDQDWGHGLDYKTLVSVVLWLRGSQAVTENYYISASRDGGLNWVSSSHDSVMLATKGEAPVQFSMMDLLPAALMIRIRVYSESVSTLSAMPTRLMVTVLLIGDAGLAQL